MAHKIEQPWDEVYSVEGTEWHRIATHIPVIGEDQIKRLSYPIIESPAIVQIDGRSVNLESYKVLVADHRNIRPDLTEDQQLVPLHIPKAGYKVIDNRQVWDCMIKAFNDLGVKVTSMGTLERGKKFFISVDIGGSEIKMNKDRFRAYVNFITSHDGELAMSVFDSLIRIVCMNTLIASQDAAGEVGFKAYHTKNADLAISNLGELFNAILKGRAAIAEVMTYLAGHKCDNNEALAMAAGYFCLETDKAELSTRTMNAAQGIATLFSRGMGNNGETLYDLANGATEFWTSGEGTGKGKTDAGSRTYRSILGSAAVHKQAFVAMLANDDRRKQALQLGKQALALAS